MKSQNLFLVLLFSVAIFSCQKYTPLEEYESEQNDIDLIIEGFIATDIVSPTVRLTKPYEFSEWSSSYDSDQTISGANVTLSDGINSVSLIEYDLKGYYTTTSEFMGEVGKTYTLTIEYEGKTYTAEDKLEAVEEPFEAFPFEINGVTELNGTEYQFNLDKHQFGFNSQSIAVFEYDTPEIIGNSDEPNLWEQKKNPLAPFSYGQNDLGVYQSNVDVIYVHTKPRLDASFPFNTDVPIFTYPKSDMVNVYQFSISDQYYEYLLALFSDTEWVGLFSSLPGNIPSNASEGALGYFWATDIQKKSYLVDDIVQ